MEFIGIDDFACIFPNDIETERTLMRWGVLGTEQVCGRCNDPMKIRVRGNRMMFRCGKVNCGRSEVSIRHGSVFFR